MKHLLLGKYFKIKINRLIANSISNTKRSLFKYYSYVITSNFCDKLLLREDFKRDLN